MSSDLFVLDLPYYSNLAPNMIFPDEISGNFFTDQISAPSDSSIDSILQEFSDDHNTTSNNFTNTPTSLTSNTTQISTEEAQSFDQITPTLFSNSPPSQHLETLSLHHQQQTHMGSLGNVLSEYYSVISETVKSEDFQVGFDYPPPASSYKSYFINSSNNSYDVGESMLKFMQRSFSSNSFDEEPSVWFQPEFNTLMQVQNFQPDIDETSFNDGQIRRACSTGDLTVGRVCSSASPLSGGTGEGNSMEESNFKVGKYSAEERKERIDRYRAKRTQRNFNKTIKYACRKTLADNRPRIRGRFARNDETGEIPKPTCFNRYEDDDELWVDKLQEEDEKGILGRGGRLVSNFGASHHFQYYGY